MNIVRWEDLSGCAACRATPAALTVGVFDGVHLGHRAILERLVGSGPELQPVVVTFSRHPQSVLSPEAPRKDLISTDRKLDRLASLGVKTTVMIDFSVDFSKMTAEYFFGDLTSAFRIATIVEGENFHFGRDRQAGRKALTGLCAAIGATLQTADMVLYRGLPVSSTRIRHAVQAGALDDVQAMLGGVYAVDLPEYANAAGGRHAVIEKDRLSQAVPEKGIFRCRAEAADGNGEAELVIEKERIFIRSQLSSIKTLYFDA
jgi:riboflavin kinase / FMN adenylyltransferase